jgi:hypothetical protein
MAEADKIVEQINESMYQATFHLRTFFGVTEIEDLEGWGPVVLALQTLPPDQYRTIGIALLALFFETENKTPENDQHRRELVHMVDVLANNIVGAAQSFIQNQNRNTQMLMRPSRVID